MLLSSPAVWVLVIEDDDFMRETLRMMLQAINDKSAAQGSQLHIPALNLSIEYAASGEQAWDMMRVKQFDLAFVDLSLPGVSGLDLSWCVKQLPQDDDGHSAPPQRPRRSSLHALATSRRPSGSPNMGCTTCCPSLYRSRSCAHDPQVAPACALRIPALATARGATEPPAQL